MGISKKLALYIFVVSVLFLIIALIYNHSQARKISLINETYSIRDSADNIAQFVSKLLTEKAQRALSIAQSSVISEELIKRNEFLGGMDDQARVKKIDSLDNLWIETKDENDPFIQGYLDNPVADYFYRIEVAVEGEYGEIFLTDKYGALVASTAKLTTLAHAHKYWWQGSYNEGSGRVFFDDRGYDDSVDDYVLGIVVPVRKNEEIIGILKCNFMVLGAISSIIENFKNEGITIGLARSGGLILYEPGSQPLQAQVSEKLIEKFVEPNAGSIVQEKKSGDVLTAYAPVPLTLGNNNHEFGGSAQSIDHRHGNRGESWYIYLSKDLEAVYALARERTYSIMMTGLALIMIMAVVSIILGYRLTKPINKLALVAKKIGDGDLNVSEVPGSKDEIGQLGKSIKNMADSLKNTLIRRDELIDEVESHRQTSEALRGSEEKLQALFSAMTEMVVLHELVFDENDMPCNYRILDCNQAFCRITGIKKETAVGKTATQLYKTESPPYLDVYAKVALSSEPTEFFTEYAPLEKHFLVSVVSPRKHIFATITSDITEVKQAEEALRKQLDFSESLIETAQAIILVLDPQGRIVRFNPYMEELVGYNLDEVKGKDWFETFIKLENGNSVKSVFQKAVDDIQTRGNVNPIIARDGRTILVEWYDKTLKDRDGRTEGVLAIGYDITERKRAEEAVRLNEEKLKSIFRVAPTGIGVVINRTFTEVNPKVCEMTGYRSEELLGKSAGILYPTQEEHEFVGKEKYRQIAKHGTGSVETRWQRKDGKIIDVLLSSTPVDSDDLSKGATFTALDITEIKRFREELKQLNAELEMKVKHRTAMLEASNKELEAFSYSVSHDLRAPLRHISGYIDLLNKRFREDLPEKAGHYLNEVKDSAHQMGTLIDDLLQFSRTGRQDLRRVDMDMNAAVQEALEKLEVDTQNRNISWTVADLPRVFGDYSLLKQVWMNLLENAVKYTHHKNEAEIEVGFTRDADQWEFFVHDNGAGFDIQYVHKLFGVFQRLHSSTEFEGTGIGLANVQRIIHKHGGRVRAEGKPEKGATFYFTIPEKPLDEGSKS